MLYTFGSKRWKESAHPKIKPFLTEIITRSREHRNAYKKSDNQRFAQLWCALAEVSKDIKNIEAKIQGLQLIPTPKAFDRDFLSKFYLNRLIGKTASQIETARQLLEEERKQQKELLDSLKQF